MIDNNKILKFAKKFTDKKKGVSACHHPFVLFGNLYASDGTCFIRHAVNNMHDGIYENGILKSNCFTSHHIVIFQKINDYIDDVMIPANRQLETECDILYKSEYYTSVPRPKIENNTMRYPWFDRMLPNDGGLYEEQYIKKIRRTSMVTHNYYYEPKKPLIIGDSDCIVGIMHIANN